MIIMVFYRLYFCGIVENGGLRDSRSEIPRKKLTPYQPADHKLIKGMTK